MNDEPEIPIRFSPKFARQQRRANLWAGLLGVVLGLFSMVAGLDAVRTGKLVSYGRSVRGPDLPGWVVVLIGLFILLLSGWVLWRFARRT